MTLLKDVIVSQQPSLSSQEQLFIENLFLSELTELAQSQSLNQTNAVDLTNLSDAFTQATPQAVSNLHHELPNTIINTFSTITENTPLSNPFQAFTTDVLLQIFQQNFINQGPAS